MGVSAFPAVELPPGMLMPYAGAASPPGWLVCDGSLVARAAYPALFAAIGTTYGAGDGSTTFALPNLKGRMPVGLDAAQTEFDTLGEVGGSKTSTAAHTHSLSDHRHGLEAHTHAFSTDTRNTNHAHNVYGRNQNTGGQSAEHQHSARTDARQVDQGWPAAGHLAVRTTDRTPELTWGGAIRGTHAWDNNAVYQDHVHNFNHDHPSTNYASESPWPGDYNHFHAGTTGGAGALGGTASPSTNTSGASSAEAAAGNLPPYLVVRYLIKT